MELLLSFLVDNYKYAAALFFKQLFRFEFNFYFRLIKQQRHTYIHLIYHHLYNFNFTPKAQQQ